MSESGGVRLDIGGTEAFLAAGAVDAAAAKVRTIAEELEAGVGPGSDFLGWLDLPARITDGDLREIEAAAARLAGLADCCIVVGIGGSYLGARAVLEALGGPVPGAPEILFAGTGLCPDTLARVLERAASREPALIVISKSGTTLEPAVAFRLLRAQLEQRYGRDGAAARIVAVTDARRGALRTMADEAGYRGFVIPDDVGGRFSVLTPVGLVPLAVAGVDIRGLVAGACAMRETCRQPELRTNPAHLYAVVRHGLYGLGFTTEVLSSFHGDLDMIAEWWKQLFGESEGKGGKGIFPASTVFTTDLHSLGQYLQDGCRNLQETFLTVRRARAGLAVPAAGADGRDLDGLDYLAGMSLDVINRRAWEGTRTAHIAGGVPCTTFELDEVTSFTVGALLYLFEKAVAVSGRLLGVNPFDQPGVEAYKQEMFRLLGRPGA